MQKLAVPVKEALEMSSLGKTKLYELINSGALDSVTVGRKRLIKVDSLRALLEAA